MVVAAKEIQNERMVACHSRPYMTVVVEIVLFQSLKKTTWFVFVAETTRDVRY